MSEEETRDDIIDIINNEEPVKEAIIEEVKEAIIEEVKEEIKPKAKAKSKSRAKPKIKIVKESVECSGSLETPQMEGAKPLPHHQNQLLKQLNQ